AGGGIVNATFDPSSVATLTLRDSSVSHNQETGGPDDNALGGGGIANVDGTVKVDHSQVNGNTAQGFVGGGIATGDYFGSGGETPPIAAGGIANGGDAVLDHSRVDNNMAPNGIGAGVVNHATMTLSHSEVNGNTAAASGFAGSGGGIFNAQGPPGTGGGGTL